MKNRLALLAGALALVCVSPCRAQYTTFTTSQLGGTVSPAANATFYLQPQQASRIGTSGGQALGPAVTFVVTSGAGSISIPDALLSSPNICYAATAIDNVSGKTLLGNGLDGNGNVIPGGPYGCLQPTGSSWNFDAFSPPTGVNVPAAGAVVNGPTTFDSSVTLTQTPTYPTDPATKAYVDTSVAAISVLNPSFNCPSSPTVDASTCINAAIAAAPNGSEIFIPGGTELGVGNNIIVPSGKKLMGPCGDSGYASVPQSVLCTAHLIALPALAAQADPSMIVVTGNGSEIAGLWLDMNSQPAHTIELVGDASYGAYIHDNSYMTAIMNNSGTVNLAGDGVTVTQTGGNPLNPAWPIGTNIRLQTTSTAITSVTLDGTYATVAMINTLSAGNVVKFAGVTGGAATGLNTGSGYSVQASGLSGSQFKVLFSGAAGGPYAQTGTTLTIKSPSYLCAISGRPTSPTQLTLASNTCYTPGAPATALAYAVDPFTWYDTFHYIYGNNPTPEPSGTWNGIYGLNIDRNWFWDAVKDPIYMVGGGDSDNIENNFLTLTQGGGGYSIFWESVQGASHLNINQNNITGGSQGMYLSGMPTSCSGANCGIYESKVTKNQIENPFWATGTCPSTTPGYTCHSVITINKPLSNFLIDSNNANAELLASKFINIVNALQGGTISNNVFSDDTTTATVSTDGSTPTNVTGTGFSTNWAGLPYTITSATQTDNITSITTDGTYASVTASNTLTAGDIGVFSGVGGGVPPGLNGLTYTVQSSGLSGSQFKVLFSGAAGGPYAQSGTVTFVKTPVSTDCTINTVNSSTSMSLTTACAGSQTGATGSFGQVLFTDASTTNVSWVRNSGDSPGSKALAGTVNYGTAQDAYKETPGAVPFWNSTSQVLTTDPRYNYNAIIHELNATSNLFNGIASGIDTDYNGGFGLSNNGTIIGRFYYNGEEIISRVAGTSFCLVISASNQVCSDPFSNFVFSTAAQRFFNPNGAFSFPNTATAGQIVSTISTDGSNPTNVTVTAGSNLNSTWSVGDQYNVSSGTETDTVTSITPTGTQANVAATNTLSAGNTVQFSKNLVGGSAAGLAGNSYVVLAAGLSGSGFSVAYNGTAGGPYPQSGQTATKIATACIINAYTDATHMKITDPTGANACAPSLTGASGSYPGAPLLSWNTTPAAGNIPVATGVAGNVGIGVAGVNFSPAPSVGIGLGDTVCAHAADTTVGAVSITGVASTSSTMTYTMAATPSYFYIGQIVSSQGNTTSGYNAAPLTVSATTGTTVTVSSTNNPGAGTGGGTLSLYCSNQSNDALNGSISTYQPFSTQYTIPGGAFGVSTNALSLMAQLAYFNAASSSQPAFSLGLDYGTTHVYTPDGSFVVPSGSYTGEASSVRWTVTASSASLMNVTQDGICVDGTCGNSGSGNSITAGWRTAVNTSANHNLILKVGWQAKGLASGTYTGGIAATGTVGQTCTLTSFNNGNTAGAATVALTGTNTIAGGTSLVFSNTGYGNSSASTSATAGNGTATCSGTAVVSTTLGGAQGNALSLGALVAR